MAGIGAYKQIMLVKKVPVKGADGNWISDTETKYPVWAEVVRKGGTRTTANGQTQANNVVQFRIKFNPVLNPGVDWKVIYSGHEHTLHSIEQDEEKRFHWIINAESIGDK